jgi:hypothetical protein
MTLHMTRKWFAGVVALSTVLWNGLLYWIQDRARGNWEESLRQSDRLFVWWLFVAGLFMIGYVSIAGLLLLLARKSLGVRVTPVATSVLIDLGMTMAFWCLQAVFEDPLLEGYLASIGLRYLPTFFFWTGVLWFLIAFVRLRLLYGAPQPTSLVSAT